MSPTISILSSNCASYKPYKIQKEQGSVKKVPKLAGSIHFDRVCLAGPTAPRIDSGVSLKKAFLGDKL
jgi:hypothetical protein